MALVELELKEKFVKHKVDSFFRALEFLVNVGYSELEAFSNALYFFPTFNFEDVYEFIIQNDYATSQFTFKVYFHDADVSVAHLKEFMDFCCSHRQTPVGMPYMLVQVSLSEKSIVYFLIEKIMKSGVRYMEEDINNDELPF